jgi:hypothetical protein
VAAAGQRAAIKRGLRVEPGRDPLGGHAQRVEKLPDRLDRLHHGTARIEPAQVDVQLAVGESRGRAMSPVQSQGGLSDPGHAGDRRLGGVQFGQFGRPPGEREIGRRKLGDAGPLLPPGILGQRLESRHLVQAQLECLAEQAHRAQPR